MTEAERSLILTQSDRILATDYVTVGRKWWEHPARRMLELVVAGGGTACALPFLGIAAGAVWMEDGHSPFLVLQRTHPGKNNFGILKLRSMVPDAQLQEDKVIAARPVINGSTVKSVDPRITRVGRIIRRTSLDEVPQLWYNVIADRTLSLIGCRQITETEWKYKILPYKDEEPYIGFISLMDDWLSYGVTGLSSVLMRGVDDYWLKLTLEVRYANQMSLAADLRIIARTLAPYVLFGGR